MSYFNEIVIGLAVASTFLWWLKVSKDEKLRKNQEEEEHKLCIQNLSKTLDFDQIKELNNIDFTYLIGLLSWEDASSIIDRKNAYNNQVLLKLKNKPLKTRYFSLIDNYSQYAFTN